MKKSGFKNKTYEEKIAKLKESRIKKIKQRRTPKLKILQRDKPANKIKRAIKILVKLSHDHVKKRDGIDGEIEGYCFDCGKYAKGSDYHAGHFFPDGGSGALLRYHPHNMHGQAKGCNMKQQQEKVKINYTLKMIEVYGSEYVEKLRKMRNITIDADLDFYQKLIELYKVGDDDKIVDYLDSLYDHYNTAFNAVLS